MAKKKLLELNEENYYSQEANKAYLSCSQIKDFMDCEAKAMARLNGEYEEEKSTALWVGSYVDAALTGTKEEMDKLLSDNLKVFYAYGNPEKGLKADFKKADKCIERVKSDETMMKTLSGDHQVIMTGELFGVPTKIKIDSYKKGKFIVDLKTTADMQKGMYSAELGRYVSWIEGYKYTLQMAIYREIVKQNTNDTLPCYLTVVDKTDVPDIGIFQIDSATMDDELENIKDIVNNIDLIKKGKVEAKRCEKCDYCKSTKKAKILDWREVFGEIEEE